MIFRTQCTDATVLYNVFFFNGDKKGETSRSCGRNSAVGLTIFAASGWPQRQSRWPLSTFIRTFTTSCTCTVNFANCNSCFFLQREGEKFPAEENWKPEKIENSRNLLTSREAGRGGDAFASKERRSGTETTERESIGSHRWRKGRGGGEGWGKEQRARHVFPFPRFIIRERERGTLIVRHNLLSANRRGVDVKHVQTREPDYTGANERLSPSVPPPPAPLVSSVSFSIECPWKQGFISSRVKWLELNWVVRLCSRIVSQVGKTFHSKYK